jgi:nucleoside-diphosphate-sugar epimerase
MAGLKIFVTGASGFIGEALVIKMLEHGHHVVAAHAPVSAIEQANPLPALDRANVVHLNLNLLDCDELLPHLAGCDCVVHLARNRRDLFQEQLRFAFDSNRALLQACKRAQVKKCVYVSSTAVYGDPPPSMAIAEDSPYLASLRPQTSIHQAVEKLLLEADPGDTEVIVLQLGQVYGSGGKGETARTLNRMKTALTLLARSGRGYCHPIYIDDVAIAIIRACETPHLHRQRFIIGPDQPATWREFLSGYEAILAEKALMDWPVDYSCEPQDAIPFWRDVLSKMLQKKKIREGTSAIAKAVWGKSIDYPSPDDFRIFAAQPIFSNQKSRDRLNFQPQISLPVGMAKIREWWHQNCLEAV